MKPSALFALAAAVGGAFVASSCGGGDDGYDASGVFEATEVVVSAMGAGEILWLDAAEGTTLEAGQAVG